jgi:hypothetical protein
MTPLSSRPARPGQGEDSCDAGCEHEGKEGGADGVTGAMPADDLYLGRDRGGEDAPENGREPAQPRRADQHRSHGAADGCDRMLAREGISDGRPDHEG